MKCWKNCWHIYRQSLVKTRPNKKTSSNNFSVCSFAHLLCVHTVFEQNFVFHFFFYFSPVPFSPSLHQNISRNWLTPSFFKMHSWRHPGRAKMLCMLSKMIHMYTTHSFSLPCNAFIACYILYPNIQQKKFSKEI